MSKTEMDPRRALITFIKPNGMPVRVNSFSASLQAAVDNGWLPEKEFKAAKRKTVKAKKK